jgi:DNA-binding MarR family transcriptional regulator
VSKPIAVIARAQTFPTMSKMVENGYLKQERSVHDRRTVRVSISDKGMEIYDLISVLYDRHIGQLANRPIEEEAMNLTNEALRKLERFWAHELAYGPRSSADIATSAA